MNKNIIFFTEKGEEIKNSLSRYLRFVKNESCEKKKINEHFKKNYFDAIYPALFEGCSLYFIFDDTLDTFEFDKEPITNVESKSKSKNLLTNSGLMFSILVDLSISKKFISSSTDSYEIFTIKNDIIDYINYNNIEIKIEWNNPNSSDNAIPNFSRIKELIIEKYGELISTIYHQHCKISGEDKKEIELRIADLVSNKPEENKDNPMPVRSDSEKNQAEKIVDKNAPLKDFEEEIKNNIFVLIIDDVLGDYNKTFLPFYTFIKSLLFEDNKKLLIMRGICNILPEGIISYINNFPADIVLVDIDFEELGKEWENNLHYRFYYTEGRNKAGVKLYEQLLSFTNTALYTKKSQKPKIFIFTGIGKSKDKISMWISKDEIDELKDRLDKLEFSDSYFHAETEDIFKKLVYLRKYRSENAFKDKKIWETITLIPANESELVRQNWKYYNEIAPNMNEKDIKVYTGLEEIKFNNELKPIIGEDRIKINEEKKQ